MSASAHVPEPLRDLIDDYLSGLLDEGGVRRLEEALRDDPAARAYFVRYARLHTDLHLEIRARRLSERGLAEVRFQCGARVVLQGPAKLALLSGKGARLVHGKLTARVPAAAAGFEILAPQGKVIDLGTEFGVAVSQEGNAEVYVFEGK